MNKTDIKNNIVLRKANEKDCRKIFFLFNDSEVRHNSLNQEKISYENHKNWFLRKIHDKKYIFLIAETRGLFVGQVRFDIEKSEALTSTSIHKRFRGFGLGKILLIKGLEYLKKYHPEIRYATGEIKADNIAAIKNSEYAGFVFQKEDFSKNRKILQYRCDLRKIK